MTQRQAGFYWARRKDDDELTIVEFVRDSGEPFFQLIGNSTIADEQEIATWFEVLERIPEPPQS